LGAERLRRQRDWNGQIFVDVDHAAEAIWAFFARFL
jgi:hypothetical protein